MCRPSEMPFYAPSNSQHEIPSHTGTKYSQRSEKRTKVTVSYLGIA